jgi:hypothetical protein
MKSNELKTGELYTMSHGLGKKAWMYLDLYHFSHIRLRTNEYILYLGEQNITYSLSHMNGVYDTFLLEDGKIGYILGAEHPFHNSVSGINFYPVANETII